MLIFFMILRLALAVLLLTASTGYAEMYKYVDENGVVLFTDIPRGSDGYRSRIKRDTVAQARKSAYNQIVLDKADQYELDPSLISAVITAESGFRPTAVSRKGAMGLMQLMPATAKQLGVKDPFNPEQNIDGGTRYLKFLLRKYDGDLRLALAAYNAGPTKVGEHTKLPRETEQYIEKVFSLYGGKRHLPVRSKRTVIYKTVLSDGQVIYTNSPPVKKAPQRL